MINFTIFVNICYNIIGGNTGKAAFVRTMLQNITVRKDEDPLVNLTDDMARRIFSGKRKIDSLAAEILPYVEPTCFATYIEEACSENMMFALIDSLNANGYEVSMKSFGDDIAEIFNDILIDAASKVPAPKELKRYFTILESSCNFIKTLLDKKKPQTLDSFYIPNEIFDTKQKRKNAKKVILDEGNRYSVIQGTGGLGKSMLMRYLTLELISNYGKYKKIPIFIQLNEYNSSEKRLMDIIHQNTKKLTDIDSKLESGECVLILDAMDEIKISEYNAFCKELNQFVEDYPDNCYILSSRPVSNFMRLRRFTVYGLAPFTKKQAVAMINKVNYRPERPTLKENFIQEIEETLYETHRDFVENPLLLTIMLMTYERYAKIPSKRHVFYSEAFNTLAITHDAAKDGFDRVYETAMFPEEFSKVLQEFCARTFFAEKFEMTEDEFEGFFNQLQCLNWIDKKFTWKQLLSDLVSNLCIMNYNNGKIRFIHRSFQEYFCAIYLSKDSEDKYPYIRQFFDKRYRWATEDGAFELLYDLEPQRVERLIYIPLLREIFATHQDNPSEQYWDFLDNVYGEIYYNVDDVIDEYENLPKSYVYSVLQRKRGLERRRIDDLPLDEDYIIQQYYRVSTNLYSKVVVESEINEGQRYTECEECGYNCKARVADVRKEDSELHDALMNPYFAYHIEYREMKRILAEMESNMADMEQANIYKGMFG